MHFSHAVGLIFCFSLQEYLNLVLIVQHELSFKRKSWCSCFFSDDHTVVKRPIFLYNLLKCFGGTFWSSTWEIQLDQASQDTVKLNFSYLQGRSFHSLPKQLSPCILLKLVTIATCLLQSTTENRSTPHRKQISQISPQLVPVLRVILP